MQIFTPNNAMPIYILPKCSTTAAWVLNPAGTTAQSQRSRCAISREIFNRHTHEECGEKLKLLIIEMKAELPVHLPFDSIPSYFLEFLTVSFSSFGILSHNPRGIAKRVVIERLMRGSSFFSVQGLKQH